MKKEAEKDYHYHQRQDMGWLISLTSPFHPTCHLHFHGERKKERKRNSLCLIVPYMSSHLNLNLKPNLKKLSLHNYYLVKTRVEVNGGFILFLTSLHEFSFSLTLLWKEVKKTFFWGIAWNELNWIAGSFWLVPKNKIFLFIFLSLYLVWFRHYITLHPSFFPLLLGWSKRVRVAWHMLALR